MAEKEIKNILEKKLEGNEILLADKILSYLKHKCFICWKDSLKVSRTYCDCKEYRQMYMDVCDKCISKFRFVKCYKCLTYCDGKKCYSVDIDTNCEYSVCYYCSASGWCIE